MKEMCLLQKDAEILKDFNEADLNKDGFLDYTEFYDYFLRHYGKVQRMQAIEIVKDIYQF